MKRERPTRIMEYSEAREMTIQKLMTEIALKKPYLRAKVARRLAIQTTNQVLPKGTTLRVVYEPENWWQRFKEAFFPDFLLHRWPIRYMEK